MSCASCGHVFADFAAANELDEHGKRRLACPTCGSVEGRNASFSLSESATATDAVTGVLITKGDVRPWEDKWLKLVDALDEIRELYASGRAGESSIRIERRFDDFFTTTFHMRDWLIHDAGLPERDVDNYIGSEPALSLARALSNTEKHHTRSHGITARVRAIELASGLRVTIEEDWAQPTRSVHDALEIAEAATLAWRRFLAVHGLQAPG